MSNTTKIKVGVLGSAGYTGGELIRLLVNHSKVELVFLHSQSQQGKLLSTIHKDCLYTLPKRVFDGEISLEVDVVFLCVGHGQAKQALQKYKFSATTKIIDLSQDFRIKDNSHDFVYGLCELNKQHIKKANYIANPGCFATAIQLALLPFKEQINSDIHVHAITGSTGAGVKLSDTSHFSWRSNNCSVYKSFEHQHIAEIKQSLEMKEHDICFVPMRGAFPRGILASCHFLSDLSEQQAKMQIAEFYKDTPFVHLCDQEPDIKSVVNTNQCLVSVKKHGSYIHVVSVIDNLIKGASGQALQNMNLMFGLDENTGLNIKPIIF